MIKIGVIGCSNISKKLIKRINMSDKSKYTFESFASRSKEKAEYFGKMFKARAFEGYDSILRSKELDAVYITLPPALHFKWIKEALKHGKHVLCEKPMCVNYDETREVVQLSKQKKLVLFENYMFPFHSQNILVRDIINDNEIGEVLLVRGSFSIPQLSTKDNFRYSRELGGSSLLDTGGYPIKLSQIILGDNLTIKQSYLNYSNENNVDMNGCVTLVNENSQIAQIFFGYGSYYQCFYEVLGSQGKIFVDRAFTAPPEYTPSVILEKSNSLKKLKIPKDNHFKGIVEEFIKCILNKHYDKYHDEILNQSRLIQEIFEQNEFDKMGNITG
jgi:predicted dehydrogenase